MKNAQFRTMFLLFCVALLVFPNCGGGPKIETEVKNVTVSIDAPKAKVFEVATLTFIKGGFTISVANETVGLITTDFKLVDVGFGEAFHLALSEEKGNPEVQFGTSIVENGGKSILTMVAKGRTWSKKRGYQPYLFKEDFMNSIRNIGEDIKRQAEAK